MYVNVKFVKRQSMSRGDIIYAGLSVSAGCFYGMRMQDCMIPYIDGMQSVGGGLTGVCDIKNDVQRL